MRAAAPVVSARPKDENVWLRLRQEDARILFFITLTATARTMCRRTDSRRSQTVLRIASPSICASCTVACDDCGCHARGPPVAWPSSLSGPSSFPGESSCTGTSRSRHSCATKVRETSSSSVNAPWCKSWCASFSMTSSSFSRPPPLSSDFAPIVRRTNPLSKAHRSPAPSLTAPGRRATGLLRSSRRKHVLVKDTRSDGGPCTITPVRITAGVGDSLRSLCQRCAERQARGRNIARQRRRLHTSTKTASITRV
jgi:hypothetical protein